MARSRLLMLVTLMFATFGVAQAAAQSSAEAELRRIVQEMLDAVAPGNARSLATLPARARDSRRRDRHGAHQEGIARGVHAAAAGPGGADRDRYASRSRRTATSRSSPTKSQEHLDYHGQILRSRFRINDTWLKTEQGWQLLAEQVAAVLKDPPSVKLTQQQLCEYSGSYSLTAEINTTIRCTQDGLTAERSGRPPAQYLAEVADVFFVAGQPRTRRIFVRDAQGKVVGFVDRREGEDVRWERKL